MLDRLRRAWIFTQLDLWNADHLIRIKKVDVTGLVVYEKDERVGTCNAEYVILHLTLNHTMLINDTALINILDKP